MDHAQLATDPPPAAQVVDVAAVTRPPQREDDILRKTIATLWIGSLVAILALLIVAPEQKLRFAAPLLIAIVALVAWFAMKYERRDWAKNFLAYGVWAGTTAIAAMTGGVRAPVVIAFPVIILVSAWMISARVAFVSAGCSIASTVALLFIESLKAGPAYLPSPLAMYAGDQIVIYGLSFALAMIMLRAYRARLAALQDSEQRYRAAFQLSPDAVSINRRADAVYVDVNDGFTRITGWRRDDVIGRTPAELRIFRSKSDYQRLVMAVDATGRCESLEADFLTRDGQVLNAQVAAQVMQLDGVPCVFSVARDLTSRKQAEQQINSLAFYDPLTQLPNRRLFFDRLRQSLSTAVRWRHNGAVLFVDLDDFKTLNESLGHEQGDRMLQLVASSLLSCVREGDTVGRTGGDEFVVLLEGLSERVEEAVTEAEAVARKILKALNRTYELQGTFFHGASSVGLTLIGAEDAAQPDEPVKRAELAMYQAKTAGGNALRFFDPRMQATVSARADLAMGLREAVERQQLVLHYQPQLARDGRILGVEALLRWAHPERGLLGPAGFIAFAEETGLIIPMGSWVLQTACGVLAEWAGHEAWSGLTISVNVSARQFQQPEFVDQLLAIIRRSGAPAHRLKLELTESLLVNNVEEVIARMNRLKAAGVGFSLDDFGTGYSSLSYLKRLPLDQVKIDQGFVRDILDDANDASIARMVVALARSLGLESVAEGVETEAQQAFLAGLGCDSYQGYLFSKPLPRAEFEEFFRRRLPRPPEPVTGV